MMLNGCAGLDGHETMDEDQGQTARGRRIMYEELLILIENRVDEIAKKLVAEMQEKEEVIHYRKVSTRTREERIGNVIRDMCERLGYWLNREAPGRSLSSHYSRLGAQRFREGIPLDELVLMFLLIKRGIWDELRHKLLIDNSFTLTHLRELENNYHLFFDRIIQAVITGYQNGLMKKTGDGGFAKVTAGNKDDCSEGRKTRRSTTAKEEEQ
jgi:hypothetical protein